MNKIIAVFDGMNFSDTVLQQAVGICKNRKAHLVGVFLHETLLHEYLFSESSVINSYNPAELMKALREEDEKTYATSVAKFRAACENGGIEHSVHKKKESALNTLVQETLFADLLMIDPRDSFSSIESSTPSWFVQSVLRSSGCPALLVGKKPLQIKRPIFLYDGEPSSVHAMKLFSYLFPDFRDEPVEIYTTSADTLNRHVPHHQLVHEWVKRHYPKAEFHVYTGSTDQLITVLKEKAKDFVLVTGAYERSRLSLFLRSSFADELITEVKAPIFIAHH